MIELKLDATHICTEYGEEIERGLMNAVNHSEYCKHDALNESIDTHKFVTEYENIRKKTKRKFNPIWKKMTDKEQYKLIFLSMNGSIEGNAVLMGLQSFNRFLNYEDKMIKKYAHNKT